MLDFTDKLHNKVILSVSSFLTFNCELQVLNEQKIGKLKIWLLSFYGRIAKNTTSKIACNRRIKYLVRT